MLRMDSDFLFSVEKSERSLKSKIGGGKGADPSQFPAPLSRESHEKRSSLCPGELFIWAINKTQRGPL